MVGARGGNVADTDAVLQQADAVAAHAPDDRPRGSAAEERRVDPRLVRQGLADRGLKPFLHLGLVEDLDGLPALAERPHLVVRRDRDLLVQRDVESQRDGGRRRTGGDTLISLSEARAFGFEHVRAGRHAIESKRAVGRRGHAAFELHDRDLGAGHGIARGGNDLAFDPDRLRLRGRVGAEAGVREKGNGQRGHERRGHREDVVRLHRLSPGSGCAGSFRRTRHARGSARLRERPTCGRTPATQSRDERVRRRWADRGWDRRGGRRAPCPEGRRERRTGPRWTAQGRAPAPPRPRSGGGGRPGTRRPARE